jgi:type I restriction enzyme M protein
MDNKETSKNALENALWKCADVLRGRMDANEYKDYVLGLLFYKYLSDKLLNKAMILIGKKDLALPEMQAEYAKYYGNTVFLSELKNDMGFVLPPHLTFQCLMSDIRNNEFQLDSLKSAFNEIENYDVSFQGIFQAVDLTSKRLGDTENTQNKNVAELMKNLDNLNLLSYSMDALGDAYEYLLSKFASETGKKAGEFYTPKAVANLLAQIVMLGHEDIEGLQVYDPTCGSGSLLLDIKKYSNKKDLIHYWGQELNGTTLNLAKMNMFIHNISISHQHLNNGDTLSADWPTEEETDFHCVVMNPPYSANWSADPGFLNSPRFGNYGVLAPKSKADYAFLLHGYYHLKKNGTMGIVLPHGVLFRGAAEGKIRKKLVDDGSIYAVIGLPSNLFYSTSIPTIIMILKKNREDMSRDILFIDASKDFEKGKNQNILTQENIDSIIALYKDRKDVEKKAHLATYDEIVKNDYNLNIPRYVDTFEKEEDISIGNLVDEITTIDADLKKTDDEVLASLQDLTSEDDEIKGDITRLINLLKDEKK